MTIPRICYPQEEFFEIKLGFRCQGEFVNTAEFTALIGVGSLLAGFLGALTGLGGGVVIVPLLALVFHVDLKYAIGAALVSVIATSSGAAAAYLKEGYSNIRVGMFLEIATTIGAMSGAALALYLHASVIAVIFGVVLIYSAVVSVEKGLHVTQDLGPDRNISGRARFGELPRAGRAAGIRDHVCGRGAFGAFGNWVGGGESFGDG
jgi:uncharacterized membrane protein YfcA